MAIATNTAVVLFHRQDWTLDALFTKQLATCVYGVECVLYGFLLLFDVSLILAPARGQKKG